VRDRDVAPYVIDEQYNLVVDGVFNEQLFDKITEDEGDVVRCGGVEDVDRAEELLEDNTRLRDAPGDEYLKCAVEVELEVCLETWDHRDPREDGDEFLDLVRVHIHRDLGSDQHGDW